MTRDVRHALALALASSLAAAPLGACGDDDGAGTGGAGGAGTGSGSGTGSGGGIVDPTMTSPFVCVSGNEPFEALRTELSLDSLEHREQAEDTGEVSALALVGTVCATATDRDACIQLVGDARSDVSLFSICGGCYPSQRYLVATQGDEVDVVADHETMLAWLGPIDAPGKAWLVATQADYRPQCGEDWIRPDGANHLLVTRDQVNDCPTQYAEVLLRVFPDGTYEEVERVLLPETGGCAGRRPAGLRAFRAESSAPRDAACLSRMAFLEAASVDAFAILRDELLAHGAPDDLVRRAESARRDEIRHAAVVRDLAERRGAAVEEPVVVRAPTRSLEAIAIDNAREGCVRETYGALEAMWQARFAADRDVRAAMVVIAADETEHAALSWDLAAWLATRLDDAANARVLAARETALAELGAELASRRGPAGAGMPGAERARHLLDRLSPALA